MRKALSHKKLFVWSIILSMILMGGILALRSVQRFSATLGQSTQASEIKIIFAGDLMLDRYIRQVAEKKGYDYLLQELKPILLDSDLVVVNLEGPITDFPSRSIYSQIGSTDNFIFTFDPQVVPFLTRHNIKLVSLGNNHIHNFGSEGLRQTETYLQEDGVDFFGDTGQETDSSFKLIKLHGLRLGFVNYNQFVSGGGERTLSDIASLRDETDAIIVYTHWGNEYQTQANEVIQKQARQFIDQGADLIIGSHPHVVQQSEIYEGKKIYYSLGNFVFDQYFSAQTQEGLLVEVTIDPETRQFSFTEVPIKLLKNTQTVRD